MLKLILSITLALMTSSAFATSIKQSTTVAMTDQEIQLAIEIANKYEVPLEVDGPCSATNFEVTSRVRGYNPARWTLTSADGDFALESDQISGLIALINRIEAKSIRINSITSEQRIYVQGASCGFTPNKWTVTFN